MQRVRDCRSKTGQSAQSADRLRWADQQLSAASVSLESLIWPQLRSSKSQQALTAWQHFMALAIVLQGLQGCIC